MNTLGGLSPYDVIFLCLASIIIVISIILFALRFFGHGSTKSHAMQWENDRQEEAEDEEAEKAVE